MPCKHPQIQAFTTMFVEQAVAENELPLWINFCPEITCPDPV